MAPVIVSACSGLAYSGVPTIWMGVLPELEGRDNRDNRDNIPAGQYLTATIKAFNNEAYQAQLRISNGP